MVDGCNHGGLIFARLLQDHIKVYFDNGLNLFMPYKNLITTLFTIHTGNKLNKVSKPAEVVLRGQNAPV